MIVFLTLLSRSGPQGRTTGEQTSAQAEKHARSSRRFSSQLPGILSFSSKMTSPKLSAVTDPAHGFFTLRTGPSIVARTLLYSNARSQSPATRREQGALAPELLVFNQ